MQTKMRQITLRTIREARGQTLAECAKRVGCHESLLSRIERGLVYSLDLQQGLQLAEVYGISPAALVAAVYPNPQRLGPPLQKEAP